MADGVRAAEAHAHDEEASRRAREDRRRLTADGTKGRAIRKIAETRAAFAQALAGLTFRPELPVRPRLSERESAVLSAIIEHGTVNATAAALFVSANTVKTQLSAINRKLGVSNRDEAISVADRFDLTAGPATDDEPAAAERGRD